MIYGLKHSHNRVFLNGIFTERARVWGGYCGKIKLYTHHDSLKYYIFDDVTKSPKSGDSIFNFQNLYNFSSKYLWCWIARR